MGREEGEEEMEVENIIVLLSVGEGRAKTASIRMLYKCSV